MTFGGGMGGMMFGGMGGGMGAPVTSEDITRMTKYLGLSADQQTAVKELLNGHQGAYDAKADEFRKAMDAVREEFRETRDPSVWEDLRPKMEAFRKYRTELETTIFSDIKGVLEKNQVESWPKFEAARRRESGGFGGGPGGGPALSGERVDLVKIVENLKLPAAASKEVQPTLDLYADELDREIVKRNKWRDDNMEKFGTAMRGMFGGGGDTTELQKLIEDGRTASGRVRDVNSKYAKQIGAALPAEFSAKFENEVRKQTFPDIYRERYIDRALTAAIAMTDLEQSQRDGLIAVQEGYARDAKALNEKAEKARLDFENNFKMEDMRGMFGGGGGNSEEIRTARRELEDTTLTKIKGILSPDQQAKLPERNAEGGDRGPRGGGGGQDGQPRQRRNRDNATPAAPATPPSPPKN